MIISHISSGSAGRPSQADGALLRALMSRSATTYGCEGQVIGWDADVPAPMTRRAPVDPVFGLSLAL
ncbi:MAG: hypothetical protein GY946_30545 [bacterium]|nr:hypothetical protein [bacterium]